METLNLKYAINQLVRWLWAIALALLVGIAAAAGMFFVKHKDKTPSMESIHTEKGYFILEMTEDARQNLQSGNILEYSVSMVNYYADFLNSEYSQVKLYHETLKEFPELNENIYTLEAFRNQLSIKAETMLIVVTVKPWEVDKAVERKEVKSFVQLTLQEWQALAEQVQKKVYELAKSTIIGTQELGLADFRVSEYKSSSETVDQEVKLERLPVKKCLVVGLVCGSGVAFIVLIAALMNTRIKDDKDLMANTDLELLAILPRATWNKRARLERIEQQMSSPQYEASYALLAAKVAAKAEQDNTRLFVLMGTGEKAEEPVKAVALGLQQALLQRSVQAQLSSPQEALRAKEHDGLIICAAGSAVENPDGVTLAGKGTIILVVRQYKTKYGKLGDLAATLRQVKATVFGAVITDYHKRKWEL